jgi:hypothetical protein
MNLPHLTNEENIVKFEIFTALKMSVLVFWVVTSCGLTGSYQISGEACCHHLQGCLE